MSKKFVDEDGFTVNEGYTGDIDWSFLDLGGRIDNAQADAAFGLSPEFFQRNQRANEIEDFESLVDGAQG